MVDDRNLGDDITMKNRLLFVLALLVSVFCLVITDGNMVGGVCYAKSGAAQATGGQTEVDAKELLQRPCEPLYVYVGPDRLREAIGA
ncbi:MAG: hypothetical protein ACE5KK_02980, partial [Candidatus Brocadiales bacterium]